jgi:hypothetical protein
MKQVRTILLSISIFLLTAIVAFNCEGEKEKSKKPKKIHNILQLEKLVDLDTTKAYKECISLD